MDDRLRISERDLDRHTHLVQLEGELELETAPLLERRLGEEELGRRTLIVDLSELRFMDSIALRLLLQLRRRVQLSGGKLSLVWGTPRILRAFEVAGLLSIFDLRRTLDEALIAGRASAD